MLSMEQNITLGDIRKLKEMAEELMALATAAKNDINKAIDDNDADAYTEIETDLIDETQMLWESLGDWVNNAEK